MDVVRLRPRVGVRATECRLRRKSSGWLKRGCASCAFACTSSAPLTNDKEVTMINLAKQGFVNPFLSGIGASFQPGAVGSVGRCPCCGNAVTVASTQQLGVNPVG